MRVLITGAQGQLGAALQRCAPAGADVSAMDIEDCDLTDFPMLRARLVVEAPDIIINAAAYTAVDRAESDEALARAVNAGAVREMMEAMAETGGKLVHVSTDFVFDGTSPRPYRPGDERRPLSAYGRTKAEGENFLRPKDLLVRTSWVYEAGKANFVRTILQRIAEHAEVRVVADQIGSPTWATGLARTIWGLIAVGAEGTFHHSDAGVASWYDLAVAVAEEAFVLGLVGHEAQIRPIATSDYPTKARRPAFSVLDCAATRARLGDEPVHWRHNLRLMLRQEVGTS